MGLAKICEGDFNKFKYEMWPLLLAQMWTWLCNFSACEQHFKHKPNYQKIKFKTIFMKSQLRSGLHLIGLGPLKSKTQVYGLGPKCKCG
jgi:hypothetical protein